MYICLLRSPIPVSRWIDDDFPPIKNQVRNILTTLPQMLTSCWSLLHMDNDEYDGSWELSTYNTITMLYRQD